VGLEPYGGRRSLAARVTGASYEVEVTVAPGPADPGGSAGSERDAGVVVAEAAAKFAAAQECLVDEVREGKARTIDVRRYVDSVWVAEGPDTGHTLSFSAVVTPGGTARPERVVEALARLAGVRLETGRIVRTRIHLAETGRA